MLSQLWFQIWCHMAPAGNTCTPEKPQLSYVTMGVHCAGASPAQLFLPTGAGPAAGMICVCRLLLARAGESQKTLRQIDAEIIKVNIPDPTFHTTCTFA